VPIEGSGSSEKFIVAMDFIHDFGGPLDGGSEQGFSSFPESIGLMVSNEMISGLPGLSRLFEPAQGAWVVFPLVQAEKKASLTETPKALFEAPNSRRITELLQGKRRSTERGAEAISVQCVDWYTGTPWREAERVHVLKEHRLQPAQERQY